LDDFKISGELLHIIPIFKELEAARCKWAAIAYEKSTTKKNLHLARAYRDNYEDLITQTLTNFRTQLSAISDRSKEVISEYLDERIRRYDQNLPAYINKKKKNASSKRDNCDDKRKKVHPKIPSSIVLSPYFIKDQDFNSNHSTSMDE